MIDLDNYPNKCIVCKKNFDNGDVDLLEDNTTICHICKYKKMKNKMRKSDYNDLIGISATSLFILFILLIMMIIIFCKIILNW
jgi:hypothetical protein